MLTSHDFVCEYLDIWVVNPRHQYTVAKVFLCCPTTILNQYNIAGILPHPCDLERLATLGYAKIPDLRVNSSVIYYAILLL
jgi:hypothetical protein